MKGKLYRQEARAGIYQMTFPFLSAAKGMSEYWPIVYGHLGGFRKNGLVTIFLQEDNMQKGAEFALRKSRFAKDFQGWNKKWRKIDEELTGKCKTIYQMDLEKLDSKKLKMVFDDLKQAHLHMWNYAIFTDMFDAGSDKEECAALQKKYNFSDDEMHILLTPGQKSFLSEWSEDLHAYKIGKLSLKNLKDKYFWIRTDYAMYEEVDEPFVRRELRNLSVTNGVLSKSKKTQILKRHGLRKNPFEIFSRTAVVRDQRKRVNCTGIYALVKIMREVFRRNDIPQELVSALKVGEEDQCFAGKIDKKLLERRLNGISWFEWFENGRVIVEVGKKAGDKRKAAMKRMESSINGVKELRGTVACRGYVKAKVRVILHVSSKTAGLLKRGEVLVTNMTRPEFAPLMKKAGAIVTDEGGLSSHAAIVARELNVPCVIGTKFASHVLKDGDLVEVDANVGLVKIIKRIKK